MKRGTAPLGLALLSFAAGQARGQMLVSGRVWTPRSPASLANLPPNTGVMEDYFGAGRRPEPEDILGLPNVRCFASRAGDNAQSLAMITWSTQPTGWFRLTGPGGNYTLLFTGTNAPPRPIVLTNLRLAPHDRLDLKVAPRFDYYVLEERAYDRKAPQAYIQTFVARGTSVTQVSFRLVHDGVDGVGPGSQTVLVSIHEQGAGTPDTWSQIGPTASIPNVDAGGPKNYDWTAAWNSKEVPVTPGRTYAVRLRPQAQDGKFQAYWRPDEKEEIPGDCYRLAATGDTGWVAAAADLYMSVSTDGDGLLIPYNKRIQQQYGPFAGFARRWSQTYVAQGRGLAGVVLYAATGGSQPGIHRQRLRFRVREGGPAGSQVGVEKVAVGAGIHTGDAAWGTFGAAFAPGEVALVPGRTYAIEAESIEDYESLHGYVNIKGVVSDEKPGFNPYQKIEPDTCQEGTAYRNGTDDAGFDLDMQVVEYEYAARDWAYAVVKSNLLPNGDMESGTLSRDQTTDGKAEGWERFELAAGGQHEYVTEGPAHTNRILRLMVPVDTTSPCDAGWTQRVEGLSRTQTYRLRGRVRCSFALDVDHACSIGMDPTGQTTDPQASSIQWTALPAIHSVWTHYSSDPLRPAGSAISVWLRGASRGKKDVPFKADFDDFSLRRVRSDRPGPEDQADGTR